MIDLRIDTNADDRVSLSAMVAPEDLHCGDYVSLLNETFELPSWMWDTDPQMTGEKYVRVQLPARDAGVPFRIYAVSLPFVLLKTPKGKYRTVDTRNCQLVRLSRLYASRAWLALGKSKRKKRNSIPETSRTQ